MSKYRKLILRKIANDDTNKNGLLNLARMFGQNALIEGQDLVFPNFKRKPPSQNLECHKAQKITASSILRFVQGEAVSLEFWNRPKDGRYGIIEDSYNLSIRIYTASDREFQAIVSNELIPFLNNFECKYFIPITQDSSNFYYRQIRLVRALFYIARDGANKFLSDYEEGKKAAVRFGEPPPDYSSALENLLPNPNNFFEWIEVLSRFSPVLPSIPFRRMVHGQCAAWHFVPESLTHQNHLIAKSLIDTTFFGNDPYQSQYSLPLSRNFPSKSGTHQLLRFSTTIVDRICSEFWSLDFWASEEGVVDIYDIVNGQAALSLWFTDLSALVKAENFYDRITWATGILDKLANLSIAVLTARGEKISKNFEYELAKNVCSSKYAAWAERTITKTAKNLLLDALSQELSSNIRICHKQMINELGNENTTEVEKLTRLRGFRNLRHGTYLSRDMFAKLFLTQDFKSPPPTGLPGYVWLLSIAVLSDIEGFISLVRKELE